MTTRQPLTKGETMRIMPTVLSDGVRVPVMDKVAWDKRLTEIAGRELTKEEKQRVGKMADHNWTLRVIATELFGASHVDGFYN